MIDHEPHFLQGEDKDSIYYCGGTNPPTEVSQSYDNPHAIVVEIIQRDPTSHESDEGNVINLYRFEPNQPLELGRFSAGYFALRALLIYQEQGL